MVLIITREDQVIMENEKLDIVGLSKIGRRGEYSIWTFESDGVRMK